MQQPLYGAPPLKHADTASRVLPEAPITPTPLQHACEHSRTVAGREIPAAMTGGQTGIHWGQLPKKEHGDRHVTWVSAAQLVTATPRGPLLTFLSTVNGPD
ncbi:hypothetical protein NDU88_003119 [Pleurodeles waltl]|uniref:Uncharacterized protein n=1 Tax=Pleurodeles waltl TaxID=8319 RepID=A0AAV7QAW4_PLEWA|nr:hypothetical protein NDU88_003119 [Pleurodeles waltl]